MRKINKAYVFAILVIIAIVLNMIFKREGDILLIIAGLGFFNVIYILDKIYRK